MFICPYDAHWCEREACRSGTCELTGAPPMFACASCGAVVEVKASPKLRLCVECIFLEIETEQGA